MWKIIEPSLVSRLRSLLKEKDLYIADGHHRYEVSWAYKDMRSKETLDADLPKGWDYVMAYLCPMEEPGLLMLPTHRLIKSDKTFEQWKAHLKTVFDIAPVKTIGEVVETLARLEPSERALGWMHAEGFFLLTLKKDLSIDRCMAHRPEALRSLDVVLLHDIALGEGPGIDFLKDKEVEYTRDIEEMVRRTKPNPAWVGFLLASPGVESLARVAKAGEVMPPKTTYFYPKVPTGFTLMPLNKGIS